MIKVWPKIDQKLAPKWSKNIFFLCAALFASHLKVTIEFLTVNWSNKTCFSNAFLTVLGIKWTLQQTTKIADFSKKNNLYKEDFQVETKKSHKKFPLDLFEEKSHKKDDAKFPLKRGNKRVEFAIKSANETLTFKKCSKRFRRTFCENKNLPIEDAIC